MIKIIFLIGKPAAGKDKQADLLVKEFKFKKIVTSEELEKLFLRTKNKYLKLGKIKINLKKQKEKKDKGKLVSFRLVAWLVGDIILKNILNKNSIVFAGSPRSLYEAKVCLKTLKKNQNFNIRYYFIYLKISDKEAIRRVIKRFKIEKRIDDNLKVIKTRLNTFRKEILPMIDYLKSQGVLIEVNGEGSVNEVHKRILKILK